MFPHDFRSDPQERQWVRRRAFSVRHCGQRLYIFRANSSVSTALAARIPTNSAAWSKVSIMCQARVRGRLGTPISATASIVDATAIRQGLPPLPRIPLATWELRVGNLLVYYDVQDTPEAVVFVRAVGIKLRRRVRFGKEVIDL